MIGPRASLFDTLVFPDTTRKYLQKNSIRDARIPPPEEILSTP